MEILLQLIKSPGAVLSIKIVEDRFVIFMAEEGDCHSQWTATQAKAVAEFIVLSQSPRFKVPLDEGEIEHPVFEFTWQTGDRGRLRISFNHRVFKFHAFNDEDGEVELDLLPEEANLIAEFVFKSVLPQ